MTEAEFAAMGIKLGHRRKLQREAARRHSWPDDRALPIEKDICSSDKKGMIVKPEVDWFDQYLVDFNRELEMAPTNETQ